MPAIGRVLDLLEALSRRDWKEIERVGNLLAGEERKKRHFQAAHQITEALRSALSQTGFDDSVGITAFSGSTQVKPGGDLLQEIPLEELSELFLPEVLLSPLEDFLGEWKNEARLLSSGLEPRKTVLLHGPPGCGKTLLAKHIAKRLGSRLFLVRFDSIISSYLGETGANLKRIFDFIATNRCVLLLDELDAVAKLRDDRSELGELKRVVISLLQNLDLLKGKSVLIGTTNHPHVLDPAIWRRFEFVLELPLPDENERLRLLTHYLGNLVVGAFVGNASKCTAGLSGADMALICQDVLRKAAVEGDKVTVKQFFVSVLNFLNRSNLELNEKSDDRKIAASLGLRVAEGGKISFQELEKLSGISHSTLHHRSSKVG